MFYLTLMSKGEKRSGSDAIVGGSGIIDHPFRVAINAKGGYFWHFYRQSVFFIDVNNNSDDGMFTGNKRSNEERNNDGKQGNHKFRRRRKHYVNQAHEEEQEWSLDHQS
jgi:hypothetical protein